MVRASSSPYFWKKSIKMKTMLFELHYLFHLGQTKFVDGVKCITAVSIGAKQMGLLLQYKMVMMRSRRRRPQPPASGPSMIGAQNMEGPAK